MTDSAPGAGPASRSDDSLFPAGAGERLRAAREAQGLSLADVAARTRVPIRHLEAIESADYSGMPTPTYAVGFAKAYARAVGEDEVGIARDVRAHTASISAERQEYQPYELDDPKRLPPRGLAIVAGLVGVVVLIVALVWLGSNLFTGGASTDVGNGIAAESNPAPAATPLVTQPVPAPAGQVTLTALDRVWVRVHDGAGKTLFQNTMNPGDIFTVPAAADHPQLTVGRPDQLRVSLNGTALAPLGTGARPLKDVPIDPAALAARAAAAPVAEATPSATATPTAPPNTQPSTAPTPKSTPSPRASHAPKPKPSPSKSPQKLDLKPSAPPLPPPTGIY